jgi:hypothetical protein
MSKVKKIIVVGGGAAGFFGAIAAKEANPDAHVILMEKARQVLSKVRISGGGRCNVTHSCFDVSQLVKNYPRGEKALRGPFTRFQPEQTIEWFLKRGVDLKTESDGRMFPITDSSETIINCLMKSAKDAGVDLRVECGIQNIVKKEDGFQIHLANSEIVECDKLLVATGSSSKVYELIKNLGHTIVTPVPSLFTFNVPNSPLSELSGIAVQKVNLKIENTSLEQTGPLLITHFGFSGPAVLKLSAWGARVLAEREYKAALHINWLTELSHEELKNLILLYRQNNPLKLITSESPVSLPKNLWKLLITPFLNNAEDPPKWVEISLKQMNKIVEKLKKDTYQIQGKTTFKEEFVTCGGVSLNEVDFRTMESRICKGLYFAGEVLDIDGVTGGFNFQNAWTTSWIAGQAV